MRGPERLTVPETSESLIAEFKALVADTPSREHPWVKAVENHDLSIAQILSGEVQHYLSVTARAKIYSTMLWKTIRQSDDELIRFAKETVREELTGIVTHADVLYRLLDEYGIAKEEALRTPPTPGTAEGISRLNDELEPLSALECIAVMAIPEWEYGGDDGIAATIRKAYTELGLSDAAISTFTLHAEVDVVHGNAYFELLARKIIEDPSCKEGVLRAMKIGRDAFLSERDGQYQAATGDFEFRWNGAPSH